MEGAGFSISKQSDDEDYQGGLFVLDSVEECLGEIVFDTIIRPFGSRCERCDGRAIPVITLSTRKGAGFVDPRDLKKLTTMIEERISKGNRSRIGICGVEALLLWNDLPRVREFLMRIDEKMQRRGVRGSLILKEGSLPSEDLRMIRETLSQ